ncbi:MAG TPA: methyltransferase domain-containing protein [Phototrophicaceae bacterium]|nr:methyltransferase domain-containing protein [Phototrophicaceae bacterium]
MVKYTFGTDDEGAIRLESIGSFFNPLAAAFIRRHVQPQPHQVAVDLGCGPGFTTAMLAQATGCAQVYGLDRADYFIQMAAARFPNYTFIQHDLTQLPFPVQADVMYVRFVLSHLSDAVQTVNHWVTALKPGGLLFIDETETVETEVAVFRRYLALNAGMIATQGANLWIGPQLAAGQYAAEVVASTCETFAVTNHLAATWFLPNIQTVWQTDAYVQGQLAPDERQAIAAEVAQIKASGDTQLQNRWNLRRLVLRRKSEG